MRVLLILSLLAVSAICMATADIGKSIPCCRAVSSGKPGPELQILDFYVQQENPPCVDAILFTTNKPKIICANPKTPWVRRKQQELRQKKNKEKQN
ncbi:hypothetical protein GDO81_007245 [Engystomops pustulosus]|uniref:Chemokine interleukin-8-like domain-containing protein n=1 Tax=Engystomops pustulosus TaxID=76066 RepID=A0AAV7C6R2_ENGPU|nr:hypothetical protein GDO81_007245 [Engystomops pustulosus]